MSSPFVDPVVAEIHAVRQQMLATAGGDVDVLMQQVVERQNQSGRVIIRERLPGHVQSEKSIELHHNEPMAK